MDATCFLVITSLQVQDLMNCLLDEDYHVMKVCLHRRTNTTVGGLLALLECLIADRERVGERESYVSVYAHVHACIHSDFEH